MVSEEEALAAAKAMLDDQEDKKTTVVETLAPHCNATSHHGDLRAIGAGLKEGDKLVCNIIAGGKTNFSYKVFLEKSPEKAVFAKICFSYALWNPDRSVHYDLARTENEFKMMKQFSELMGENAPVAIPYLCVDASEGMKLFVAQWAPADEQWSNQFIDGEVDHRVIPKVAEAFAKLNCIKDFDPMFNNDVRAQLLNIFSLGKTLHEGVLAKAEDSTDALAVLTKEIGKEGFDELLDNLEKEFMTREALIHNDSHTFNILVEAKPTITELKQFGDKGSIYICDWEMVIAGPIASDPGKLQFWPICCAIAHAAQGHKVEAYDIMLSMYEFWDAYAAVMVEHGRKDQEFLRKTYRGCMGWASIMIYQCVYLMGIFVDVLPLGSLPEDDRDRAMRSIGLVGLKLMRYGFGNYEPDLSLEGLRARYKEIIECEISVLSKFASTRRARPRRMSTLRAAGRSVSDASLYDETARRLSVNPADKRASIFDINPIALLDELDEI